DGSVISAAEVHRIEMIALGDNFATLVPHSKSLI
ncbi:MAG: cysteine hydrolase, partial [Pseudomonadales bacterium]